MEENKIDIETQHEIKINNLRSGIIAIIVMIIYGILVVSHDIVVDNITFVLVSLGVFVVFTISFAIVRAVLFFHNMIKKNGLQKLMKMKFC